MPAKTVPGRKAGKDHARSQCPEKHPGTQGCLWQEARPTSSGSDAGKYIPGSDAREPFTAFGGTPCTEEHQWTQGAEKHRRTQCRQRSCRDARLARIMLGRNARRSIRGRKAAFGRRRGRLRREVMLRKIAGGSDAN